MTEKEKKQYMVIGALVPVLLIFLFMNMNKNKRYHGTSSRKVAATGGTVSDIITEFDSYVKLIADKEINDGLERVMSEKIMEGWERNPFEILVSTVSMDDEIHSQEGIQKSNEPEFAVSGIVYDSDPDNISVIIDGDFYKIGDNVNGWNIINVEAESVYFKRGETEYIFNLYEK